MMQVISKNQGLTGGYLDATRHIMVAVPRLLSVEELDSVRVQMAQLADTARLKQEQASVKNH